MRLALLLLGFIAIVMGIAGYLTLLFGYVTHRQDGRKLYWYVSIICTIIVILSLIFSDWSIFIKN